MTNDPFDIDDATQAHIGSYLTRHSEDTWIILRPALLRVVTEYKRARSMGISEDIAVGIAILYAECKMARNVATSISDVMPKNVPFDDLGCEQDIASKATDRVAGFLHREFAPPVLYQFVCWLKGDPINSRRTKDAYVRELTDLLSAWPSLPRTVIN